MTRVRSVWNASIWMSNISLTCSSNVGGMPTGRSTTGSSRSTCSSAFRTRRSMSRTACYAVSVPAAPSRPSSAVEIFRIRNFCTLPVTVSGNASTSFQCRGIL